MRICRYYWVVVVWLSAFFASAVYASDSVAFDAFINRNAVSGQKSVRSLVYGNNLSILPGSSKPISSLLLLHDGESGDIQQVDKTFLSFEGNFVRIGLTIPQWRGLEGFSFTAIEPANLPATLRLSLSGNGVAKRDIGLTRKILNRKEGLALVEYVSSAAMNLSEGRLVLDYKASGVAKASLGEIRLDHFWGPRVVGKSNNYVIQTIEDWQKYLGKSECARVLIADRKVNAASTKDRLKLLLGNSGARLAGRLVYWHKGSSSPSGSLVHSLLVQVDNTGDARIDFVRAWLVLPAQREKRSLPLVLLPQQGHLYGGMEAAGVLGEKELELAVELASHGVVALIFDSFRFGNPKSVPLQIFQYYPTAGYTSKDLMNLDSLLTLVLDRKYENIFKVKIDESRIGIWGFSYGAWISMLAAVLDERISAVAFSSFHYHDKDIASGLSSSLYIPQLSCLDNMNIPLSVPKILGEYKRNTFAVVPDAGLADEWRKGLDDKRVNVVINPFGHVVTEYERAQVLNFFFRSFDINGQVAPRGPQHDLPIDAAGMGPYVARENQWRTELLKALTAK